ncbi:MAG TPA: bifunctional DNA primase/polymerase [Aliidongia sp.]|nr:bifunctional DNA primase/polymerase [Aliidongia sp.]
MKPGQAAGRYEKAAEAGESPAAGIEGRAQMLTANVTQTGAIANPALADEVVDLAMAGWRLFPLTKERTPYLKGWPDLATSDMSQLSRWWRAWPDALIGVLTGAEAVGFIVIDVDCGRGKVGAQSLAALEAEHGALPKTVEARTASGGRHLYFTLPSGVHVPNHNAGKRLGLNVDVKGMAGYVVAPPSRRADGGAYAWTNAPYDTPMAPCPTWLLDRIRAGAQLDPPAPSVSLDERDIEAAEQRAIAHLKTAPAAVANGTGEPTTFSLACLLKNWGVPEHRAVELMMGDWNGRCSPPWDQEELAAKVANSYAYAQDGEGSRSPAADFEAAEELPPESGVSRRISETAGRNEPDDEEWGPTSRTKEALAQPAWLFDECLPADGTVLLFGRPGLGKSTLLTAMAIDAATGAEYLGFEISERVKVRLALQEDAKLHQRRKIMALLEHNGRPETAADGSLYFSGPDNGAIVIARKDAGGAIIRTPFADKLVKRCQAKGCRLLVLDPFVKLFSGLDENNAADMQGLVDITDAMAREIGGLVVITHHENKAGGLRGSIGIESAFRHILHLVAVEPAEIGQKPASGGPKALKLYVYKSNVGEKDKSWYFRLSKVYLANEKAAHEAQSVDDVLIRQRGSDGKRSPRIKPVPVVERVQDSTVTAERREARQERDAEILTAAKLALGASAERSLVKTARGVTIALNKGHAKKDQIGERAVKQRLARALWLDRPDGLIGERCTVEVDGVPFVLWGTRASVAAGPKGAWTIHCEPPAAAAAADFKDDGA